MVFNNNFDNNNDLNITNYDAEYQTDCIYPNIDQIGRGKNQVLEPAIFGNNGINPRIESGGCVSTIIQVNRDFYNATTGISVPDSCSGSGFFLHNNVEPRKIYKCNGSTFDLYYMSYTYPHPLRGEGIPPKAQGVSGKGVKF